MAGIAERGRGRHHHNGQQHHHHAGDGGAHHGGQMVKYPFIWGAQQQYIQVAAIPFVAGQKAPTVRIPKNGFMGELLYRFVGTAAVSAVGTSGTPSILQVLQSINLSYNGGFSYRDLDGETTYVMDLIRNPGPDCIMGGPSWKNYSATSATTQNVGFIIRDYISLNNGINADKYNLAAQARNADITLDVTFGSNPNGTPNFRGIAANTETVQISGTLFVEGLYLLDPPSYARFDKPNLRQVQQIQMDTSYTNVTIGDNVVSVTPLNGPKYLGLAFKAVFNGVGDQQGYDSSISRIQLKINNGLNRYDLSSQALAQRNCQDMQREQVGPLSSKFNAALPRGWYYFDFLSDASIQNAVSQVGRNVISTERIASLWLIVTVMNGVNLTQNNLIQLIKRVELPAVGGTNKLISPAMNGG